MVCEWRLCDMPKHKTDGRLQSKCEPAVTVQPFERKVLKGRMKSMKLMQSICCLFSSRCASEAPEARETHRDTSDTTPRDANTAPQNRLVPQLVKPKILVRARRTMPAYVAPLELLV